MLIASGVEASRGVRHGSLPQLSTSTLNLAETDSPAAAMTETLKFETDIRLQWYNQDFVEGQKYEVVFPRKLLFIYKGDTQSTYPDLLHYELQLNGNLIVIHIEKTIGLFADNYTESHYKEDGTLVTNSPKYKDHCLYQGHIEDDVNSTVVLSTCKGLSGTIQTNEKSFFIEPLRRTDTEEHVVYEAGDMLNHTCGVSGFSLPLNQSNFKSLWVSDAEKRNLWNSKKYVEMYMVADKSIFNKYDRSIQSVKQRLFNILNYVNKVYKSINIYVALIGIEVWDSSDQIEVVSNVDTLLHRFSQWRINSLLPRKHHDNAQFLTDIDFNGTTIGYASMSSMCEPRSSAINQDIFTAAAGVGATIAHEMGHNLGMNHDTAGCTCGAKTCIMFPSVSSDFPLKFSGCSTRDLRNFIYNSYPNCLLNVPAISEILSPAICGNKFVENGEECDCGEPQFAPAGSICRPAKDECDLADLCDGMSPTCKNDSFKMNGYPCMKGQGACYKGTCPIIRNQCAALWGRNAAAAPERCFDINTQGDRVGHCKKEGENYIACEQQDKKCGLLFCVGGEEFPKVSGTVYKIGTCKTHLFEGGLVSTGTKCSDTNVCFNGKCSNIKETYMTESCSKQCQEHAVCDHELRCQCEQGWAPPHCNVTAGASQFVLDVSSLWWWPFMLWILALDM
ncbi:zinc metalloproteinase-disintegrin-like VLAIP-B [Mantella aurantiaca]